MINIQDLKKIDIVKRYVLFFCFFEMNIEILKDIRKLSRGRKIVEDDLFNETSPFGLWSPFGNQKSCI